MEITKRLETAEKLKKENSIRIGKDTAITYGCLVYIDTETPPKHPYDGYLLDNPMTLDTFTHIYLLDK